VEDVDATGDQRDVRALVLQVAAAGGIQGIKGEVGRAGDNRAVVVSGGFVPVVASVPVVESVH
jgi:hypothetical protein